MSVMEADIVEMRQAAERLRLQILEMLHTAGSGHAGGSLSCVEILTVLYDAVLNVRPSEPTWTERDRLVLSKGHAAPALYATLARKGYFDERLLSKLRQLGSPLQGHPSIRSTPGVDMSSGSLGMGLSVGVGMALAARAAGKSFRVFVICGDGELQEGQNWEAMMSAVKWNLDNLTMIVDRNHVQLDGPEEAVMPLGELSDKIKAFGWHVIRCAGHDVEMLLAAINTAVDHAGPAAVMAETVKGKGVSFMEGQAAWHGKPLTDEDYEAAIREITARIK